MKSDLPKISIIIPVYNAEDSLPLCIESILTQSYSDFELLLINDGSTDYSGQVCNKYVREDNRIKVFHQENKGVSRARNVGLNNAKGKWVLFCDSDDYLVSDNSLSSLQEYYNDDISLIQFSHYNIKDGVVINNNEQDSQDYILSKNKFLQEKLFKKELWKHLFRRSIIESYHIRFLEEISYAEDWEFVITYVQYIETVYISRKKVYSHIYHISSLMTQVYDVKFLFQHLCVLEAFLSLKSKDKIWNIFLKRQSSEILHFFLKIILKCNITDLQMDSLEKNYRHVYGRNYIAIGMHLKFMLAYISLPLYLFVVKKLIRII